MVTPHPLETMNKHTCMLASLLCQTTKVRLPNGTSHNEDKVQDECGCLCAVLQEE